MLLVASSILALGLVHAEILEPSDCGAARGRFRATAFSSVSSRHSSATQIHPADSVNVVLVYNGVINNLPVLHAGSSEHYDVALPAVDVATVASAHMELRHKNNASLVLERTQSVAFWVLPQGENAADWRATSAHIDMMVSLSQHLKGRGDLQDAMQASRCAFERQQPRTFQTVTARINFICALAALSPSQHVHMREALDLATQLKVARADCCPDIPHIVAAGCKRAIPYWCGVLLEHHGPALPCSLCCR